MKRIKVVKECASLARGYVEGECAMTEHSVWEAEWNEEGTSTPNNCLPNLNFTIPYMEKVRIILSWISGLERYRFKDIH